MPEPPRLILSCEHGANLVPAPYAASFVGQAALLASHRGWDPGALAVAEHLARHFRCPLFATSVTRLLIDTNRSLHHPRLFSVFSKTLPPADREAIIECHYHGHRRPLAQEVAAVVAAGCRALHVAIHSFTPELDGKVRRAELGLLYHSARPAERLLGREWQQAIQARRPELAVRRNYPYLGKSDSLAAYLRRHYGTDDYLGVEVEINQRLLTSGEGCRTVAELLAATLEPFVGGRPPAASGPGDEMVMIVDSDNRVAGAQSRREMRRQNLIHRATYILVFNAQGELFVQRRTMSKDIYPGFYDIAAGGVVLAGESYEESAERELQEELGVTAALEFLGDRYFAEASNRVWGRIYRCRHEGPFLLQATEVESGEFMTIADILSATDRRFTPDGLRILEELVAGEGLRL